MKRILARCTPLVFIFFSMVAVEITAAPLPDFSDLIEKTSPAVVKITAVTKVQPMRQMRQIPEQDMQDIPEIFRELLEQHQMPQRERGSLGSGFIISSDGYVLTNNHVVADADEIKVVMSDEREFIASVVGTDQRSDLALLKIDAKNLPQLSLAKNEKLRVGQWVVAIGSPFGLDYSASAGIVSAIGRDIDSGAVPFIQTDVAINPGNSGGPLFNMDGEVVGINSQIYTPSGGSVGLSFAIPSSVAIDVVSQLKEKGHVDRGWLGVSIQNIDKDLASSYGLDRPQGALVADVVEGSPAAKAGVKSGDLVVQFNGKDIHTAADLSRAVGRLQPNTKADFEIIRKRKHQQMSVVVGKMAAKETAANTRAAPGAHPQTKTDALGLAVQDLEGANRKEDGVEVVVVQPDSPAQRIGIMPGDVITQLDFVDVDSVAAYHRVVDTLPKNVPKAIRFLRNGTPVFRSITLK